MDVVGTPQVEKVIPSCSECRRRKAKCNRSQPCDNCTKFNRSCSYERVSRTPLTRKHLSTVEKELARTKALLRQYENRSNPAPSAAAELLSPQITAVTEDVVRHSSGSLSTAHNVRASERHAADDIPNLEHPTDMGTRPDSTVGVNHVTEASPAFSMETSPTAGEFDWDERVKSNTTRFIDGMASLTERTSRGYMGVASGAALLRLADGSGEAGTDIDTCNPEDPLQETPPLPNTLFSSAQLEPFVDSYFQTYHISYPIVHEASFRAQFMEVIPRPKGTSWLVLLHIVAALGSFAASETAPEVDVALFEAAKARMSFDMLETGNIVLVQAMTLMSNYVQKRNKPNSGYNYMGLAKRMAMGIGLHKEFEAWHSKPLRLEIRRRVYWCLYIFDVGATITFSRPLDLPREGIEIQIPLNVSDSDITAATVRFPSEANVTTLYTHVRCQSQFHLATSEIYARLISTQFPTAEEMLSADDSHLVRWLHDLPSYYQENVMQAPKFRLSHAILQWRWRNFRIIMYRPFLIRKFMTMRRTTLQTRFKQVTSQAEENAIHRCLEAAGDSVRLITLYWQSGVKNVLACWYSLYFLFQATLIPVICLRNEPQSTLAQDWRSQIFGALEVMADMTHLNSAASRCHGMVLKLCGNYLATDMAQWGSPTSESPLTQLNALNTFMWPMTDPQNSNSYDFPFFESVPYDFVNQYSISNLHGVE